jgi:branched-chain amino acid transport system substrate-binding protein
MSKIVTGRISRRSILRAGIGTAALSFIPAMPGIVRAQAGAIKLGQVTTASGRVAQIGITSKNAILMEIEAFNNAGGLNGRKIEFHQRDSKGKPEDAARFTRELIESEGCEIILDCEGSGTAFAVHEVVRNSKALVVHCLSETTQLSADPKLKSWNAFRTARQALHDSIVGGSFAAQIAKRENLTRWATVAADYAYGRDVTPEFLSYVEASGAKVNIVAATWPKLFQPDYTENITKVLEARPEAMFCGLWGGDLVAFIDQGNLFGLFDKVQVFSIHMADYTTLTSVKTLPKAGVYSSNRYISTFPATPQNAAWSDAYAKRYNSRPTNWSWESSLGARFVIEGMKQTGSAEPAKIAEALKGLEIDSPVGIRNGKIQMRSEDQTIIYYALGWGRITPKEPYLVDVQAADWDDVIRQEAAWKKKNGYA